MRVIITEQGRYALDDILSGGIGPMGRKGIKSFYATFKSHKTLLPENPFMGSQEPLLSAKYRSIVLHPFVKMIYSIENGTIYINDFWNTLRDPKYLTSRIH